MKKMLLLLGILPLFCLTYGQEADSTKTPSFFSGTITATNNGISLIPSFSAMARRFLKPVPSPHVRRRSRAVIAAFARWPRVEDALHVCLGHYLVENLQFINLSPELERVNVGPMAAHLETCS